MFHLCLGGLKRELHHFPLFTLLVQKSSFAHWGIEGTKCHMTG